MSIQRHFILLICMLFFASTLTAQIDRDCDIPNATPVAFETLHNQDILFGLDSTFTLFYGDRVVLIIDKLEDAHSLDVNAVMMLVSAFDKTVEYLEDLTDIVPSKRMAYSDRIIIAVKEHIYEQGEVLAPGQSGIWINSSSFNLMYQHAIDGSVILDYSIIHSMLDSYLYPYVSDKLNYSFFSFDITIRDRWLESLKNVIVTLISTQINEVNVAIQQGVSAGRWRTAYLTAWEEYKNNDDKNWESNWIREFNGSIHSGALLSLVEQNGGNDFIKNLLHAIPYLVPVFPSENHQQFRDNYYLAASAAAERDLISEFENEFKFIISDDAKNQVTDFITSIQGNTIKISRVISEAFDEDIGVKSYTTTNEPGWLFPWCPTITDTFEVSTVASSLTYPGINSTGNKLKIQLTNMNQSGRPFLSRLVLTRHFSHVMGCEEEVWFSILINPSSEISDFSHIRFGARWSATQLIMSKNELYLKPNSSDKLFLNDGETNFIVARIKFGEEQDKISAWVNPTVGTVLLDSRAIHENVTVGSLTGIAIETGSINLEAGTSITYLDEIRMAPSWSLLTDINSSTHNPVVFSDVTISPTILHQGENIQITGVDTDNALYAIFNSSGKPEASFQRMTNNIILINQNPGIYMLVIQSKKEPPIVKKFVVY